MGLFSEGIPFFGKKKPAADQSVQNGPTTPFSPTSIPAAEANPVVTSTTATEAGTASSTNEASSIVAPDLSGVGTVPSVEAVGAVTNPIATEDPSQTVDISQNTGLADDASKDKAVGMAAMSNAFPGTVMQPPQETEAPTPVENKSAA